jgi:hypothetical protein
MADLPPTLEETRLALQQVAVHVLARRRHAVTGRFGLRPSPGGLATPAFGDQAEVVRTCGRYLVVERGGEAATVEMTSLRRAAELTGVDLPTDTAEPADGFSVGADTPAMVHPDQALHLDDAALEMLAEWYGFGSIVIDEVVATTPTVVGATARQLWPEHFDLGGAVTVQHGATGSEVRANIGASPGDDFEPTPYLYLGLWDADRPGEPSYWNASFGAVLRHADLATAAPLDRRARASAFLRRGLGLLAGSTT